MDVSPESAEELAMAAIVLLLRSGVVKEGDVLQLADEYSLNAGRSRHDRPMLERVAHMLRLAPMQVAPPPATDPEVEFRAQYERRQMIARTKLIERKQREAGANGGNSG